MATVIFTYNGFQTKIQCKQDDKIKDIRNKFISKICININPISFIYSGKELKLE